MDFKKVTFKNSGEVNDILIALLSNIEFDSFEENENDLIAYIKKEDLNKDSLSSVLNSMPLLENLSYEITDLENKNWNEVWESSFQAVVIDNKCTIRASFHDKSETDYEIIIEPKMAFGTGHHATTEMMISFMLDMNFKDKTVLDFGCGTGILSILAEKLGASNIFANDIEEPAYENVDINSSLNNCTRIDNNLGGIELVPKKQFDIILANVNTKALSENLHYLLERMHNKTPLMLSGILNDQKEIILKIAKSSNLRLINSKEVDKWTALLFVRNI